MRLRLAIMVIVLGATLAGAAPAGAVPAPPDQRVTLRQPDGARFTARIWGDEAHHGYETVADEILA